MTELDRALLDSNQWWRVAQKRAFINKELREAIRTAINEFDAVKWGYDGDCGSGKILERLEEHLTK